MSILWYQLCKDKSIIYPLQNRSPIGENKKKTIPQKKELKSPVSQTVTMAVEAKPDQI